MSKDWRKRDSTYANLCCDTRKKISISQRWVATATQMDPKSIKHVFDCTIVAYGCESGGDGRVMMGTTKCSIYLSRLAPPSKN